MRINAVVRLRQGRQNVRIVDAITETKTETIISLSNDAFTSPHHSDVSNIIKKAGAIPGGQRGKVGRSQNRPCLVLSLLLSGRSEQALSSPCRVGLLGDLVRLTRIDWPGLAGHWFLSDLSTSSSSQTTPAKGAARPQPFCSRTGKDFSPGFSRPTNFRESVPFANPCHFARAEAPASF